ncbi:cytochrome b/b6 domain-containing protein [Microbulbifer sp. 2205BS26-8]|uniref:cytochrome b/b6 domain-containing protein n=1 Tax=Microbulbifer sp. 2205BS26-8 TaxID=3064386 RepID=UPI00273FF809|nr:cytochrome b/b6 domain-containing protein [Microbulbifer sp. 2205BS26-8]MDP5210755.1 cytochrome b/b6 domain-containing protein [Microbulbifer sp. 2205BS26-8]
MLKLINDYLDSAFSPVTKYLHFSLIFLSIAQIILSEFMDVSASGVIGQTAVEYFSTWLHIGTGLLLLCLSFVFTAVEFRKNGFFYFYPYLVSDFSQLKSDINHLKKLALPEPAPRGLAAIIQGLGLGALLLVVISGCTWFVLWLNHVSFADTFKEIHESLTGLIEIYIIGHGALGVIHVFIAYQNREPSNASYQ